MTCCLVFAGCWIALRMCEFVWDVMTEEPEWEIDYGALMRWHLDRADRFRRT